MGFSFTRRVLALIYSTLLYPIYFIPPTPHTTLNRKHERQDCRV